MKCLSLTAPYGTLIALAEKYPDLGKHNETRNWATSHRGDLLIHQAQGLGPVGGMDGLRALINQPVFFETLMRIVPNYDRYCDIDAIIAHLPLGKIVAKTELLDCREIVENQTQLDNYWNAYAGRRAMLPPPDPERSFGLYTAGRFAWLLRSIVALPEPIPARGMQGLWNYEGAL